jgi:hypothetical protein
MKGREERKKVVAMNLRNKLFPADSKRAYYSNIYIYICISPNNIII